MSLDGSAVNGPALVVVRTRPDGTSARYEVARAVASEREPLAAVVAADPALHAVRHGEIVEVTVGEGVARPVEVLAMMRPVGRRAAEDPASWPGEVAEAWADFDGQDAEQVLGSAVSRWVSVNGQRATAVVIDPQGGTQRSRCLHLVLFTKDRDAVEPLEELAEHTYDDDWGSAGGVRLDLIAPGLLWEHGWGDSGELDNLILRPATKRALDELVEQWVDLHVPDRDEADVEPKALLDEPDPLLNGAALVLARRPVWGTTAYRLVHRREAKSRKALAALIAGDPGLHEVRGGELLKIAVDPAVMGSADLLALLRPVGSTTAEDGAAWPQQVAEAYGEVDEAIEALLPEIDHVSRWVTINGTRATGALDPHGDQLVRLVLLDEDGENLAPLRALKASSWYSQVMAGSTEHVPAAWLACAREAVTWWAKGEPLHDVDINTAIATTGTIPPTTHFITGADGIARAHITASDLAVWLHLETCAADPFDDSDDDDEI